MGRPGDRQPAYVLGYDLKRLLLQRHRAGREHGRAAPDTGRRDLFPAGRDVVQRLGLGHPGLVGNPFVVERAAREISCPSALRRRSLRPLSDTTIGGFIRSFFRIAACDHPRHLIGGASSAGRDRNFDGLCWAPRAAIAGALATTAVSAAAALLIFRSWFLPYGFVFSGISRIGSAPYTAASGSRVQASRELRLHDFRQRSQNVSGAYLPFQLGVRLLRNASIPSRKSSLI